LISGVVMVTMDVILLVEPEGIAFDESYAEVLSAESLPVVTLIVIGHNHSRLDPILIPSAWPDEVLDPIWQASVQEQVTLVLGISLSSPQEAGTRSPCDSPRW
jgi:hypothetical protein